MAKAAFNKKTLFTSKWDLNLRKKLVKCFVWYWNLDTSEGRSEIPRKLESGAGEESRRSVGPIVVEMKNYYTGPRRREYATNNKQKEG
jgi:hypothetical protein